MEDKDVVGLMIVLRKERRSLSALCGRSSHPCKTDDLSEAHPSLTSRDPIFT